MKTRNILLTVSAALLSSLLTVSCSHLLDIDQKGVLNYETYYQTDEQIEAADIAMYLEVRGWMFNAKLAKAMFTDDNYCGGAMRGDNADLQAMNEFTFDAEESYIEGMFSTYYSLIYKANVILGHVDEEQGDVARQARAEARVFRAFAYFDLISMWGNPPLVDHELAPSEYNKPNGTSEELWGLVVSDLTQAIDSGCLVSKTGVNDNSTWRVTREFAEALLGKAYLWMATELKDNSYFAKAAAEFDKVISSGLYALVTDMDVYAHPVSGANKHNSESVFESNFIYDANNAWQNFGMYHLMIGWRTDRFSTLGTTGHASTGWGFRCPTKGLYDAFVSDEGVNGKRLNATILTFDQVTGKGAVIANSMINDGYFYWKQIPLEADIDNGTYGYGYSANCLWMRYAEVLLCAAEAHFMAGNTATATNYLNMIRNRAGLADIPASLDAIKLEKRLELCAEGVRFQDLLRWGEGSRMAGNGSKYPTMQPNGIVTYTDCGNSVNGFKAGKHEHLPYPATEIRLNSEIVQNPGW